MPRCSFGHGTRYQCRKMGIGNPPLCRHHADLVADLEDEEEIFDEEFEEPRGDVFGSFLEQLLDLDPARMESVIGRLRSAWGQYKRTQQDPHYAECPPRTPPQGHNGAHRAPPPPPPSTPGSSLDPRTILGFPPTVQLTEKMVKARQRALAAIYHPDAGGSEESMKRVNLAVSALLAQIR